MGEDGQIVSPTGMDKNTPILAAWFRALTYCLARSRVSLIVLAVGFALLMSDQGRDVLIAYAEDNRSVSVALAAAFWAFSIWGWGRMLLDIRYDELPACMSCYNLFRKWLPRLLGAAAFVVLALSAYQTKQTVLVWWASGGFASFIVAISWRRPVQRRLAALSQRRANSIGSLPTLARALQTADIDSQSEPPHATFMEMLGVPGLRKPAPKAVLGKLETYQLPRVAGWKLRGVITLVMFLILLVLAALSNFAPVWLGTLVGPLILFFLWGATWLPIGSWMSYIADKYGVPLMTLLVAVSLVSSCFNDNHEIRPIDNGVAVGSRPSVTEALDAWAAANQQADHAALPFVVVATAGGGIRAGYWTATVLGDLHDHVEQFPRKIFALSGVSGGSVGATVYRALLDVPPEQLKERCPEGMMECAQRVLGNDFLGPLVAAMLYPDMVQRFWPWPIFPDRAAALEKSWEAAFRKVSGEDKLNSSLSALGDKPGMPSLFLNATWMDNGRRIVASNLRYANSPANEAEAFVRSNDALAVLGRDLRLSTAAHNSARFPFVSPPGMWKHDGKIAGRLQDGGLFENYGAETALEILDLACQRFACPQADEQRKKQLLNIIPVVILITSDPSLPENLAESPKDQDSLQFGYEVRGTFRTYERVRGGRGAEAASRLDQWVKNNKGELFGFRMCSIDSKIGVPPLGWALSNAAKATINSYLFGAINPVSDNPPCYKQNFQANLDLRNLLAR